MNGAQRPGPRARRGLGNGRFRRTAALLLALLAMGARLPAAEAESSAVDWFVLAEEAQRHWRLEPDPADTNRATIRPRETAIAARAPETVRVHVLFAKPSSAYDTAMRILLERFRRANVRAVWTLANFAGEEALGRAALRELETGDYALGFAMGSAAVSFLHDHLPDPAVPAVTVCAKDPVLMNQMPGYAGGSGRNIAYTSLNVPVGLQLEYLREIVPGLAVIGVLYATENTSTVVTQVEPLRALAQAEGIRVVDVGIVDRDRAREELASRLPVAARRIREYDPEGARSLFWVTGATSVFREIETIDRHAGGIPVLSAVPDVVQPGAASAILSIGVGFESNAHLAAHYGLRVLRGEATADALPVGIVTPPDVAVNFRKAREAGLCIPFRFFEAATTVYDSAGLLAREEGRSVHPPEK